MIVYDLICRDAGHPFEGWFGSSGDFEEQKQRGLVSCPACGSTAVEKAVMAPNVGVKGNQRSVAATGINSQPVQDGSGTSQPVSNAVQVPAEYQELIGKLAKAQEKLLEKSEWVGGDFTEKARSIHYGESDEKPIHGTASAEDAAELEDEGIDIAPLPLPIVPPESQN